MNSDRAWSQRLNEAGIVLDFAPDLALFVYAPELLIDVRDDALTLNAAHEEACRRRDSEMELSIVVCMALLLVCSLVPASPQPVRKMFQSVHG